MDILEITNSSGEVVVVPLRMQDKEQVYIGRSEECAISFPEEATLSRFHAIISYVGGRYYIQDNQSVNGVILNEERVDMDIMRHGRVYILGLCSIRLAEREEAPPQPESPAVPETQVPEPEPVPVTPVEQVEDAAPPVVKPQQEKKEPKQQSLPKKSANPPKGKRRLTGYSDEWLPAHMVPTCVPGGMLGLPVQFRLEIRALLTRYPLQENDLLNFCVMADRKSHVCLLQYDSMGEVALLVPEDHTESTVLFPDLPTRFPKPTGAEYELAVEPPFGHDTVVALACSEPLPFFKLFRKALTQLGKMPSIGQVEHLLMKLATETMPESSLMWSSSVLRLESLAPEES